jgi:diaminopimelate decarboxylase
MSALDPYAELLPIDCGVGESGHLTVGGCDTTDLAERFGTPLVVLDRATFEAKANEYALILGRDRVFYAGKAFLCTAICELVDSLGLGLDVCSGGELATARAARFPPNRLIFHGNNKSSEELALARESNVGRIVVDSFDEIERIAELNIGNNLLVRLTPGVEADTHEFIRTGGFDSKFGFGLNNSSAMEAVRRLLNLPSSRLMGLHVHLGSQISDLDALDSAVTRIADFSAQAQRKFGFEGSHLNLGGGFAIAHTNNELAPSPAQTAMHIVGSVQQEFSQRGLRVPAVELEPGRSVVGPAGITLYRVGTVKRRADVRTYVSVDGGMGDNIRPPLYGARYGAFLANRVNDPVDLRADIVGKFCESGDYLIKEAHLPHDIQPGDLVCVPATGAYTFSMASNYNRQPRPAVVLIENGEAIEIVRRETYDDVLRLDRRLDGTTPQRS